MSKSESSTEYLLQLLDSGNYQTYNREVARSLGSINAAVLLSELVNRYLYHKREGQITYLKKHEGSWFYYTIDLCQSRTILSRDEQDTAIDLLESHGLIKKVVSGVPAKRYFQIITEEFKKLFSLRKSRKLDCGNSSNKNEEIPQTIKEPYKEPKKNNNKAAPSPSASPPPAESVVVFSCLDELSLKDDQKSHLTASMDEDKAITLVKRVKRWEGRSSDYLAIQTILSRWDGWEDSQTQAEKDESLANEESIQEEKAAERKERASQILSGLEIAPFKITEDVLEVKTKRGFHRISWKSEEIDRYLDSLHLSL